MGATTLILRELLVVPIMDIAVVGNHAILLPRVKAVEN
jgi:hypothetical protein